MNTGADKVLFWDFDGTLAIPNRAYPWALNEALVSLGYEVPWTLVDRCTNTVIPWHTGHYRYPQNTGAQWWKDVTRRAEVFYECSGVKPEDYAAVSEAWRRIMPTYPHTLYDDAVSVLRRCTDMGFTNCVLSNNYPELPDAIRMLGLGEFFTAYFVSGAIGYDKPRTEIYLHALREMGNPETAYMIGDNPVADIKGAKLAGLKTVWVHPNDPPHPDGLAYADFICTELAEIPDVLA